VITGSNVNYSLTYESAQPARTQIGDVDPGVGPYPAENMYKGVRVCFDPLKCHILSSKIVVG